MCTGKRLLPSQFLAIKEAMYREKHETGSVTWENVSKQFCLPDSKLLPAYHLLAHRKPLGGNHPDEQASRQQQTPPEE